MVSERIAGEFLPCHGYVIPARKCAVVGAAQGWRYRALPWCSAPPTSAAQPQPPSALPGWHGAV